MAKGRLALNSNGEMTICTSSPENLGKGRCNHIDHQSYDETNEQFAKRANKILSTFNSLYNKFEKLNAIEQEKERKLNSIIGTVTDDEILKASYKAEENEEMKTEFRVKETMERLQEEAEDKNSEYGQEDYGAFIESMKNIIDYGNFVVCWDQNAEKLKSENELKDYQSLYVQMDGSRKIKHDAAISSISLMNNICKTYGMEPFYEKPIGKDTTTRTEIAEDILQLVLNNAKYLKYVA